MCVTTTMNNTSNLTSAADIDIFTPSLILFIVFQQLTFVVACLGNGLVVIIFTRFLKRKSITNKFVIQLAIADFLTGIATGYQLFYFLFPEMNTNKMSCFLRYQVISFLVITSQLTVTFTTLDRYIAICHPHQYKTVMTEKSSNILVGVTWVISLLLSILPFTGLDKWTDESPCIYDIIFQNGIYLVSALITVIFSIAAFIMYIFILRRAWVYYKRVQPSHNREMDARSKHIERDVRGAKIMGIVALCFTLCWTPFTAHQLKYSAGYTNSSEVETHIANWVVFLGLFNSVINPFVYAWQRKDFSQACSKLFGRNNAKADSGEGVFSTNASSN